MAKIKWTKIRNEYINGNISYRKLAEKYGISYHSVENKGSEEKWVEKRKAQREKIADKIGQKTAEKIANKEANRMTRIVTAADKLLEKLEIAIEQLDKMQLKDKRRYTQKVIDKKTGREIDVFVEEEVPKTAESDVLDRYGMRQIASTLKDLKDIQSTKDGSTEDSNSQINITISAASKDDMEED